MDDNSEFPENLDETLHREGIYVPEHTSGLAREVYADMLNGRCGMCRGELGKDTHIIQTRLGVVMVYCSGPCLTDHMVMGWIREQADDIMNQVAFRGNKEEADGSAEPAGDDSDPRDDGGITEE